MKTKNLLLWIVLLLTANCMFPTFSSAQWLQTSGPYLWSINHLASDGTNIFAGTSGGVFLSTNNGSSWTAMNYGLTSTPYVRA